MSKEYEQVGLSCQEAANRKWIAKGINSTVYRDGSNVLKVYRNKLDYSGQPDFEKLKLYQTVTNRASDIVRSENWTVDLPFPFKKHKVEINPILSLKECDACHSFEAISSYIPRPNLYSPLYSFFYQDFRSLLGGLSYRIEKQLDMEGINIVAVNVKIHNSMLIVTDLCVDINDLDL